MLSEPKFRSFAPEKQHKKLAEAIREVYGGKDAAFCQKMRRWLGMTPLLLDPESLSDAYHYHMSQSGRGVREEHLLPKVKQGDRAEKGPPTPCSLYLDRIRSAHNVGSILRSAEAFNIEKIYFSKETPLPIHPQVKKISMGSWEWIEWEVVEEPPRPLVALETCEGAIPLQDFAFPKGCVLAIGNEEFGCGEELLQKADYIVEIQLHGKKNSLNVANCAAIALHQATTHFLRDI